MRSLNLALTLVPLLSLALLFVQEGPGKQERPVGYKDTPVIPGQTWRVHDGSRPAPRVVTPGETTAAAPADAIVLFDGTDLSQWTGRDDKASWRVADGYMEVNGTGAIRTRETFGDVQLHLEWASPAEVKGQDQGRGNSGVFLMGRYEVQVLDCFENRTYPDGQAAAMYGQFPPLVNACKKPGEWQTYDIFFRAPRFDGKELTQAAMVTVVHNGVVVHHGQEYLGGTSHRTLPKYNAHGDGPIELQDHGNPVRFRNVWVRRLTAYDAQ